MQVTASGGTTAVELDESGIAKGGVHNPWVDFPIARYTTTTAGPGNCGEMGQVIPFAHSQVMKLYPSAQDYWKKVTAEVDALVKARWFTESDGKKMKASLVASFDK